MLPDDYQLASLLSSHLVEQPNSNNSNSEQNGQESEQSQLSPQQQAAAQQSQAQKLERLAEALFRTLAPTAMSAPGPETTESRMHAASLLLHRPAFARVLGRQATDPPAGEVKEPDSAAAPRNLVAEMAGEQLAAMDPQRPPDAFWAILERATDKLPPISMVNEDFQVCPLCPSVCFMTVALAHLCRLHTARS